MTPLLVPMATGAQAAFWICAPLMVIGAIGLVLSRKAVYSALCLALVMVCLAVQYAAQDAPFLFVVQIIVYTGAILMLFLFVVMLVGVDTTESIVETLKGHRIAATLAGLGLLILLILAVGSAITGDPVGLADANAANGGNVQGLAALIFTRYIIAFEATAALLITAALAAMVLAHGERLRPRIGQTARAAARIDAYAKTGAHPGARPNSGVFARHNSIDTPALLPDGTVAEESVSQVLLERTALPDVGDLGKPTSAAFRAIEAATSGKDEEE